MDIFVCRLIFHLCLVEVYVNIYFCTLSNSTHLFKNSCTYNFIFHYDNLFYLWPFCNFFFIQIKLVIFSSVILFFLLTCPVSWILFCTFFVKPILNLRRWVPQYFTKILTHIVLYLLYRTCHLRLQKTGKIACMHLTSNQAYFLDLCDSRIILAWLSLELRSNRYYNSKEHFLVTIILK